MNLLIIGGLFVVAVLAIVGAVLLSRGGDSSSTSTKNTPTAEVQAQTNLIERSGPAGANTTSPAAQTSYMSAPVETSYTSANSRLAQPLLNGQFRELAGEIRTLHQQAWQLEQRLSALTEMVNQIERASSGYSGEVEETQRIPSDNTAG